MTPDERRDAHMAKAERMRGIRERELAAFESQVLVKAGKRDEYGQPVRKKSRPREVKTKPKKPRPPSERADVAARRAEVKRLHGEGLDTAQIAERVGIAARNVRRHLVALGVDLRSAHVDDRTLATLNAAGLTNTEIGARVGMTRNAVWMRMNRLGLPSNPSLTHPAQEST